MPWNVMPSASISPLTSSMGTAEPSLQNSYQTSTFTFHSKLHKPTLTASTTIIISEEETNQVGMAQTTSSHSQEDSVLYGDMAGVVYNEEKLQEDPQVPEEPWQPINIIQDEIIACEPVQYARSTLNLVPTPDGAPVFDEHGFVTWVAVSNKAEENKKDESEHA